MSKAIHLRDEDHRKLQFIQYAIRSRTLTEAARFTIDQVYQYLITRVPPPNPLKEAIPPKGREP